MWDKIERREIFRMNVNLDQLKCFSNLLRCSHYFLHLLVHCTKHLNYKILFITEDVTPPKLTFTMALSKTNSSATIQWTFDETATSSCTLQSPHGTFLQVCNGSWTGQNLVEGLYTLYVTGTDSSGNSASPKSHFWVVGKRLIFLLNKVTVSFNKTDEVK